MKTSILGVGLGMSFAQDANLEQAKAIFVWLMKNLGKERVFYLFHGENKPQVELLQCLGIPLGAHALCSQSPGDIYKWKKRHGLTHVLFANQGSPVQWHAAVRELTSLAELAHVEPAPEIPSDWTCGRLVAPVNLATMAAHPACPRTLRR